MVKPVGWDSRNLRLTVASQTSCEMLDRAVMEGLILQIYVFKSEMPGLSELSWPDFHRMLGV